MALLYGCEITLAYYNMRFYKGCSRKNGIVILFCYAFSRFNKLLLVKIDFTPGQTVHDFSAIVGFIAFSCLFFISVIYFR